VELADTRRALHAVAEFVMAGPQYRLSGTIRLAVRPGGFGTEAEPDVRVEGGELVSGSRRIPIAGLSATDLAAELGMQARRLDDVYDGGSRVPLNEPLAADPDQAAYLAACLGAGDAALRRFAPGETPVLWPEHFDVGSTVGEINYGVSPGDDYLAEPYAYVGPWQPRTGPFWNAPFGAARPIGDVPDVDAIVAFFEEGRASAQ
jgi:hypothetical protein